MQAVCCEDRSSAMLAAWVNPANSKLLMTVIGTLPGALDSTSAAHQNWLVVTMQPAVCGCTLPRSCATSPRPTAWSHRLAWICTRRFWTAQAEAFNRALALMPPSWLKRATSTCSNPVRINKSLTNNPNCLGSNARGRFLIGSNMSMPAPVALPAFVACSGISWSSGFNCQSPVVRARSAAAWSTSTATSVAALCAKNSKIQALRHWPTASSCCSRLHLRSSSKAGNRQRLLSPVAAPLLLA